MRHELPDPRGAFEPGATPAAPPFGAPFIVVCTLLAFGFLVCVARVLSV